MAILVLCTIVHFYTTGHLTAVTALKPLDAEFEAVSASLKVPFFRTFCRVTVPICTPTLLDIARYFFVNAMTTISAVVFLYSPDTKVASDRHPEPGRGRRDRRGRRHGDADPPSLTLSWRAHPPDPGPLTTTLRTKLAMLRDWGSWDATFNAVTTRAAQAPAAIVNGEGSARRRAAPGQRHLLVEAAVATLVPRDGHCWCSTTAPTASAGEARKPDGARVDGARLGRGSSRWTQDSTAARGGPEHHPRGLMHCETGAGVLNPLPRSPQVCAGTARA